MSLARRSTTASRKHGRALPLMCVLVIKKDEKGNPVRAKNRIVVLGNRKTRPLLKGNCFAPVASHNNFCLLVSLAVQHSRTAKQGDCKNTFCHPKLPNDEVVLVRPPSNFPISKPNMYWHLQKTLYGLRRSPRHWYECVKQALGNMGMQPLVHAQCLFVGTPLLGNSTRLDLSVIVLLLGQYNQSPSPGHLDAAC